jgi:hypothetical protein
MQVILCFSAWCEAYWRSPYAVNALRPECWTFEKASRGSVLQYRVHAGTREDAAQALDDLQPAGTCRIREDTLAAIDGDGSESAGVIWFGSRAVEVDTEWCEH